MKIDNSTDNYDFTNKKTQNNQNKLNKFEKSEKLDKLQSNVNFPLLSSIDSFLKHKIVKILDFCDVFEMKLHKKGFIKKHILNEEKGIEKLKEYLNVQLAESGRTKISKTFDEIKLNIQPTVSAFNDKLGTKSGELIDLSKNLILETIGAEDLASFDLLSTLLTSSFSKLGYYTKPLAEKTLKENITDYLFYDITNPKKIENSPFKNFVGKIISKLASLIGLKETINDIIQEHVLDDKENDLSGMNYDKIKKKYPDDLKKQFPIALSEDMKAFIEGFRNPQKTSGSFAFEKLHDLFTNGPGKNQNAQFLKIIEEIKSAQDEILQESVKKGLDLILPKNENVTNETTNDMQNDPKGLANDPKILQDEQKTEEKNPLLEKGQELILKIVNETVDQISGDEERKNVICQKLGPILKRAPEDLRKFIFSESTIDLSNVTNLASEIFDKVGNNLIEGIEKENDNLADNLIDLLFGKEKKEELKIEEKKEEPEAPAQTKELIIEENSKIIEENKKEIIQEIKVEQKPEEKKEELKIEEKKEIIQEIKLPDAKKDPFFKKLQGLGIDLANKMAEKIGNDEKKTDMIANSISDFISSSVSEKMSAKYIYDLIFGEKKENDAPVLNLGPLAKPIAKKVLLTIAKKTVDNYIRPINDLFINSAANAYGWLKSWVVTPEDPFDLAMKEILKSEATNQKANESFSKTNFDFETKINREKEIEIDFHYKKGDSIVSQETKTTKKEQFVDFIDKSNDNKFHLTAQLNLFSEITNQKFLKTVLEKIQEQVREKYEVENKPFVSITFEPQKEDGLISFDLKTRWTVKDSKDGEFVYFAYFCQINPMQNADVPPVCKFSNPEYLKSKDKLDLNTTAK